MQILISEIPNSEHPGVFLSGQYCTTRFEKYPGRLALFVCFSAPRCPDIKKMSNYLGPPTITLSKNYPFTVVENFLTKPPKRCEPNIIVVAIKPGSVAD